MMELFTNIKAFVFNRQKCIIDNYVFRLHYRATVVILLSASVVVSARQYIGDPINCLLSGNYEDKIISTKMMDTFCWIHTTFSVLSAWNKTVGSQVPYPGVDRLQRDDRKIHHAYYQWVCFALFFQAIFFYAPRYFWKCFEGGRIKNLLMGLESPMVPKDQKVINQSLLVNYLFHNRRNFITTFAAYCVAEVFNLVNVIFQMYLMDVFLGGEFTTYGWKVMTFAEWDSAIRFDPMIKVFPRITKCTFFVYGPSGDIVRHDAMCLLPINIINEKIYVFLWFWFYLLAIITFFALVFRIITIVATPVRFVLTYSRCNVVNRDALNGVIRKTDVGDWFVLHLLAKNLDMINFRDLIHEYYQVLNKHHAIFSL